MVFLQLTGLLLNVLLLTRSFVMAEAMDLVFYYLLYFLLIPAGHSTSARSMQRLSIMTYVFSIFILINLGELVRSLHLVNILMTSLCLAYFLFSGFSKRIACCGVGLAIGWFFANQQAIYDFYKTGGEAFHQSVWLVTIGILVIHLLFVGSESLLVSSMPLRMIFLLLGYLPMAQYLGIATVDNENVGLINFVCLSLVALELFKNQIFSSQPNKWLVSGSVLLFSGYGLYRADFFAHNSHYIALLFLQLALLSLFQIKESLFSCYLWLGPLQIVLALYSVYQKDQALGSSATILFLGLILGLKAFQQYAEEEMRNLSRDSYWVSGVQLSILLFVGLLSLRGSLWT